MFMRRLGEKVRDIPLVELYEELSRIYPDIAVVRATLGQLDPSFIKDLFCGEPPQTIPDAWSTEIGVGYEQTMRAARVVIDTMKGERNGSS